ncbi:unnamed protein product, partial [Prorocentrum cordatum]
GVRPRTPPRCPPEKPPPPLSEHPRAARGHQALPPAGHQDVPVRAPGAAAGRGAPERPAPARELPGLRRRGRAGAGVLRRRHALRPLREGARQRRYPRAAHRPPDPPAPPRAGAPAIPRRGAPGREAGEHDALRRLGAPPRGRTEAR